MIIFKCFKYSLEALSKEIDVKGTETWKKYTGSYLDENFLIPFLTPKEYFYFVGNLYGVNKDDIDEFLGDEVLGRPRYIRNLSKGNQKKTALLFKMVKI